MGARGRLAAYAVTTPLRMTPATEYRLSILAALWGQPRSVVVRFALDAGLEAITQQGGKACRA